MKVPPGHRYYPQPLPNRRIPDGDGGYLMLNANEAFYFAQLVPHLAGLSLEPVDELKRVIPFRRRAQLIRAAWACLGHALGKAAA